MRNPGEQQQCGVCEKDLGYNFWTYTKSKFSNYFHSNAPDLCSNKCVIDFCKQIQDDYKRNDLIENEKDDEWLRQN